MEVLDYNYKGGIYNNCSIVHKPELQVPAIGFFLYLTKKVTNDGKNILIQFNFDSMIFSIHDKQIKLEFNMVFKLNQYVYYIPLISFTQCEHSAFEVGINNIHWDGTKNDDAKNIFMYCSSLVLLSSNLV